MQVSAKCLNILGLVWILSDTGEAVATERRPEM